MTTPFPTDGIKERFGLRLRAAVALRCKQFVRPAPKSSITFCIAHFNSSEFLDLVARDYELEFWYFQIGRHASKLACSLAKFRRPKAHRCADVAEMLAAAKSTPGPAQIYFIGQPKKK
jgi:hypothetical protein